MDNNLYSINLSTTERPSNKNFRLHTHENYEILLFIEGDTNYIVEGVSYTLKPNDVIVIRKNEMHRAYHNSNTRYQRYVISLWPEFFERYDCKQFESQFLDTSLGNRINSGTVISEGIYDALMRLKKYTKNLTLENTPVEISIIIEILYLLSNTQIYKNPNIKATVIANVVDYINNSFTENICLDTLEKKFFLTKFHLSRSFKQVTGLTIHQYITQKRLAYAKELTRNGKNIGEAAQMAGFNSYPTFYRAYREKFNSPPKSLIH